MDEAQDSSLSKIELIKLISHDASRIIAVGDKFQSIYGFSGADSQAMQHYIDNFNCIELPLSISYRCAKNVVNAAQVFVPTIESSDFAQDGIYEETPVEFNDVAFRPNDMIVSRITAPLVAAYWSLMNDGTPCKILGKDIATGLVKLVSDAQKDVVKRTRNKHYHYQEMIETIRATINEKIAKTDDDLTVMGLKDKFRCLKIIHTQCESADEMIAKIGVMFSEKAENCVILCSVHKSKGLEADRVFIMNREATMPHPMAKKD